MNPCQITRLALIRDAGGDPVWLPPTAVRELLDGPALVTIYQWVRRGHVRVRRHGRRLEVSLADCCTRIELRKQVPYNRIQRQKSARNQVGA